MPDQKLNEHVCLIGAGNMGGAMLTGWLEGGLPAKNVTIVDPGPAKPIAGLIEQHGMRWERSVPSDLEASVVFLAVKPQTMEALVPKLAQIGGSPLFITIAAGKDLQFYERYLPLAPIVRAMPNTPALIGQGITAAFGNDRVDADARMRADAILRVSGSVEWLDQEPLIDAVTAVSGSGPAYLFYLTECLALAGEKAGLPRALAERLARKTMTGSAALMAQSEDLPQELRRKVTSPGGTTQAALEILQEDSGLESLMERAVAAGRDRAHELSK